MYSQGEVSRCMAADIRVRVRVRGRGCGRGHTTHLSHSCKALASFSCGGGTYYVT